MSVVFIYVLYKLYTYVRLKAAIWFGRKEAHDTPADVSYTAGHGEKGSTVNINIHNSNDSLQQMLHPSCLRVPYGLG